MIVGACAVASLAELACLLYSPAFVSSLFSACVACWNPTTIYGAPGGLTISSGMLFVHVKLWVTSI